MSRLFEKVTNLLVLLLLPAIFQIFHVEGAYLWLCCLLVTIMLKR